MRIQPTKREDSTSRDLRSSVAYQDLQDRSDCLGNWRQLFHFQCCFLLLYMALSLELLNVALGVSLVASLSQGY